MSAWISGDDLISKELEAASIRLQVRFGEWMRSVYERGGMTKEQLEFILDWSSNLPDMPLEEANTQLEAWFSWLDQTHPGWRKGN